MIQDSVPRLKTSRILLVDDDQEFTAPLRIKLEARGYLVEVAHDLAAMHSCLNQARFDIIFLDVMLGNENGLDALTDIIRVVPFSRIIMLTASSDLDWAVIAIRRGATGYLNKSVSFQRLSEEIATLLGPVSGEDTTTIAANGMNQAAGIIGNSTQVQRLMEDIARMRDSNATVLVHGETGTGKELVARNLHLGSVRGHGNFAAINCGAIPEALLESELFGHKRGAFTDAKLDRRGFFEICSGGTLFLDEIAETPPSIQVKLLRVLQEKEVLPLGSGKAIQVDTRVVVATNKNLLEEVRAGRFREDLYYRMAILSIETPSLRSRRQDIPLLVQHFVKAFEQSSGRVYQPVGADIMVRLENHDWPGNVRELRNSVERATTLAVSDKLRFEDFFPREMHPQQQNHDSSANGSLIIANVGDPAPLSQAKQQFEKSYLENILRLANGNVADAARLAGHYRTSFYRLLDKHHIDAHKYRSEPMLPSH